MAFLISFPIIVLSCLVVILPSYQRLLPQSMPAGKSACPAPRCHTSSLLPYPHLSCCNKCRISACIGVRPSGFGQFAAGACHPDAMSAHFFCWLWRPVVTVPYLQASFDGARLQRVPPNSVSRALAPPAPFPCLPSFPCFGFMLHSFRSPAAASIAYYTALPVAALPLLNAFHHSRTAPLLISFAR